MVTLTAGSGVGKTLVRELAHHLHSNHPCRDDDARGSQQATLLGLVGIEMSQNITIDRSNVTDEESGAFDQLFSGDRPPSTCSTGGAVMMLI